MSAISLPQFLRAFRRVWSPRRQSSVHDIGLAVSGGVDSMALACLCSQLQRSPPDAQEYKFRAFVVDHAARKESAKEAKMVAKRLEDMGLAAEVLRLSWADLELPERTKVAKVDPLKLKNFEGLARRLRYRALAMACLQHDISSVLLGHHQGDQVENVLLRVIERHAGNGMVGMRERAAMPETADIYGAAHAWDFSTAQWEESGAKTMRQDLRLRRAVKPHGLYGFIQAAPQGLTIHRPLLDFTKEQLVSTCEANNVLWEEDNTNKQETLTIRNTVRNLLELGKMPVALRSPRLLQVQTSIEPMRTRVEARVADLVSKTEIRMFDMRSCLLVIKLPKYFSRQTREQEPQLYKRLITSYIVHFSAMIVDFDRQKGDLATEVVEQLLASEEDRQQFSARGGLWTPFVEKKTGDVVWMIRREWRADGTARKCFWPADLRHTDLWRFWDRRFWISVHSKFNITCQPFSSSSLEALEDTEDRAWMQTLTHTLDRIGPHDVRSTIPVLIEADSGLLLAFPTLGLQTTHARKYRLTYDIKYKALPNTILPWFSGVERPEDVYEIERRRKGYSKLR